MKRPLFLVVATIFLLPIASAVVAGEIAGDYLEARTCDVYTGPCFANAEIGMTGRNALMAWSVEEGTWKGVDLTGLKVAAAIQACDTLAMNGPYIVKPFPIKSVIYVDQTATLIQRKALIDFAKSQAKNVLNKVVRVEAKPIQFSMNHAEKRGYLTVSDIAKLETREVREEDNGHT